jgi:glutamate/tyrosine decarboxylase-like PLP-dependent enzyme
MQLNQSVDVMWMNLFYKMINLKGDEGYEKQVDKLFELTQLLLEQLKARKNFDLVMNDVICPNLFH